MIRGVRRAEVVDVGGLEAGAWMKMYMHTHRGLDRMAWPDGGSYLCQLQIVVDVFDLIQGEIRQYLKEQKRNEQRN